MSDKTEIQWTDATWNPVTGCTKVSPGCAHCYIERTPAFRINGRKFVNGSTGVLLHPDRLDQPLHWRRPRRVFVNSLSDLFHDSVTDAFIDGIFAVMALTPRHTYQVLTKRPHRMRAYLSDDRTRDRIADLLGLYYGRPDTARSILGQRFDLDPAQRWPLVNVWLGVSVENQRFADERIPLLLDTPAAVRFISAEPLLAPVNLTWVAQHDDDRDGVIDALRGRDWIVGSPDVSLSKPDVAIPDRRYVGESFPGLDWVIVGGESGHGARPCDVGDLIRVVVQCRAAGVPVFVKQLGSKPWIDANAPEVKRQKYSDTDEAVAALSDYLTRCHSLEFKDRKGGDPAEWPEGLRVREFPTSQGKVR